MSEPRGTVTATCWRCGEQLRPTDRMVWSEDVKRYRHEAPCGAAGVVR